MESQPRINRRKTVVKRAIVLALSVILAIVVAAPIASGKQASMGKSIGAFSDNWWNWAFENSTATSPLVGDYSGVEQCDGFQEGNKTGVWFLAGEFALEGDLETGFVGEATRNCTVPADTPIFFPVFNSTCGEAPTVEQPDGTFTGDPKPYTKCAKDFLDQGLEGADPFATIEGTDLPITDLPITRAGSGLFTWEIPTDDNPQGLPKGSYKTATDGLWVYLPEGLPPGNYTIKFGGSYFGGGLVLDITYNLKVE
jgi:hypothetical protein